MVVRLQNLNDPVRRKYVTYFWCLVFLMCFSCQARAQENNDVSVSSKEKVFKHLTIDDGLSQSYPLTITQDSRGFMWVGTLNGLNKYDGYSFTVFTHNPYDPTTISVNSVKLILEDSRRLLWVLPYLDSGIDLMDIRTELFRKIPFNIPDLRTIAEDKNGNIWIGTGSDGLFLFESKNILRSDFHYTQYKHRTDELNSLSDNSVRSIIITNDNVLWIGTDSGLDKFSGNSRSGFEHYSIINKDNGYNDRNAVYSIFNNDDNTLWLGTVAGLTLFNKINGKYTMYPRRNIGDFNITSIVKDHNERLWINDGGRLTIFNPGNKTYNYVYKNRDYKIPGIVSLYTDEAGNIWIGSNADGLYIYFPESKRFKSFPNKKDIRTPEQNVSIQAIFEDSQNNLWFSSHNYIYKWNRSTKLLEHFGNPLDESEFGSSGASAITEDKNGNIWFATYHDLYSINLKTHQRTHIIFNPDPVKGIRGVFIDHTGIIWTLSNKYLSKLTDIKKGTFINYAYNPRGVYPVENSVIYEDQDNILWFTSNMGLGKFDQETKKFTFYKNDPGNYSSIYSNFTKCICPDPAAQAEKLWVGTGGGGLNLFNKKTGTFAHILEKDGLPDNVVYGILPDDQGNLWLSTNRGLSKYTPAANQFINYDVHDGLQSNEFNTGAFFKSSSGEMFFGGINGFNFFYPKDITIKDFVPEVIFTDIKLFNKTVSVNDSNSVLAKVISETEQIELSYKENQISFDFAILDYYAPAKNRFAYKLEGFNDRWIQLGTKREVTFTGLDPGEYVLNLKGTNSDGIWNKKITSLKIEIIPPWWLSPWAYGIYFLLILSLLYGLRRYELNRQKWKHSLELETIESFRYKELSEMKSRFFANISHEFRTPLTLIMGPSESIINEAPSQNLLKHAKNIRRNAARLLILINQLLDLSRLEAGKLELSTSRSDIVTFIKGLTMSFESIAEEKDIRLTLEMKIDQAELYFDQDKITKIITNLLSNAFKFTPEGGTITVTVDQGPGSMLSIKVKDTGIGINEADLDQTLRQVLPG